MSLFKRKKAGEEANTIPEAMDDITQTLLIPVKDEGEKTMCADAYETSQAEIASYTSIGTRKSQQDSICFDFGDFCTVCAVCDGMGGLTGGERASALAAHGVTRYLLEHAQAEDIPTEMGRAALRLNEEVKNLRDPANQKIEAGTTLTTVFLRNGKLFWCSIGDSHIYLYRKSLSLRKTKTDRVDAKTIATMLLSDVDLKSYTDTAYHNEELKSLTRYRFDKVQERAKLKQSVSRLVTILFPELEQLVSSIHGTSIYALLSEYPGAKQISEAHLTRLANILVKTSRGHYRKDKATHIRDAARTSIGSVMPAKSLELKHTIKLIQELTSEINEIEDAIRKIMDELKPPILSIPGMGFHSAAMILAEVGDFSNFNSPDKVLAYAGCSPSTYQSGKLTNCYAHMEKRGSRYLRYALYTATKYVCYWNPVFTEYLTKKQAEGKHYNVALSHATKKLVRLIYALQKSGKAYLAVT